MGLPQHKRMSRREREAMESRHCLPQGVGIAGLGLGQTA